MNSFENGSIPSGKAREVLFVGRLDNPVKGVDRLLKIWSMVCRREPGWFLRIVGDGPDPGIPGRAGGGMRLHQLFL